MEEEWRVIECYENYSVSNKGNVRNDKTRRILSPGLNRGGYLFVSLCKENKQKTHKIHRLVGIAFLENPENLPEVDHINQIKDDNRVENLRWCSRENNNRNRKKFKGASSQYLGVSWHNNTNKWKAQIRLNGKNKHLGRFDTEEDAYEAWRTYVFENNLQVFYDI